MSEIDCFGTPLNIGDPLKVDKTYEDLIALYQAGEATISRDDINRLTFKYNNILYTCGWSSERNSIQVF